MRRFAMVGAVLTMGTVLGVLAPAAGSTAAWADGPEHVKSTFSDQFTAQPGEFCDFEYHLAVSGSDNAIIFPDGRTIDHLVTHVTHTNLATGFTLTETDHFTVTTAADGQIKFVGIFWHLRNADGKIVVVQAGQLLFSAKGELLKATPNFNPDDAAVICPALGGHPAM
jgi:hypothetical protein